MKVSLIYKVNEADVSSIGVLLKMKGQQNAFNQMGHECVAYYHRNGEFIKRSPQGNEEVIDVISYSNRRFSFKDFFNRLSNVDAIKKADLVYIRYPFSTPSFLNFVGRLKQEQVIIEMPTYPYKNEWSGFLKLFLGMDSFYASKLKAYCRAIVHFGEEDKIFGIRTINSSNGIDINSFPLVQNAQVSGLKMIAVGKFNYWHGLDRLIKGMAAADWNDAKLKIVGNGPVIKELQSLVDELNLSRSVIFCGVKKGKELDALFNESNLGIGTLGIHRKGLQYNSSLKHREYCIRGLPFILSTKDSGFDKACKFPLYFPADDSPVDINEIYRLNLMNLNREEIRKYGVEKVSWKSILENIIDQL